MTKLSYKQIISGAAIFFCLLGSCRQTVTPPPENPISTDSATIEMDTVAADVKTIHGENDVAQVLGVALKNTADKTVFFYIMDDLLHPRLLSMPANSSGKDFTLASTPCKLRIRNQPGNWQIEKGKRYVFELEGTKWNLYEAE